MGGKTEANQSREGLLQSYNNGESQPLQNSQDGYSSSTDDDLDATEYLRQSSPRTPTKSASTRSFVGLRKSIRRRSKCLIILITVLVVFWSVLVGGGYWIYKKKPVNGQSPPWYPTPPGGTVSQWDASYKKAEALVKKMTLLEKVNITTGTGWQMGLAVGNSAPAIHVGFPGLAYQDGPLGLRFADNSTAFPAGVTVGATWSKELMYRRGKAHGNEARLKGINVLLGPCVGPIGKLPAGGRNWEVGCAQLSAIYPIQN
jgi:hypothetical protein